jgi:hypothetical protein
MIKVEGGIGQINGGFISDQCPACGKISPIRPVNPSTTPKP